VPDIDVSGISLDAFVAGEQFEVIERIETVNGFGESTVRATSAFAYGSIQPIPTIPSHLLREAAFDSQEKVIHVITPYLLRGASARGHIQSKPSMVLWKGDYYEVRNIDDYSSYGQGHVEAECIAIPYNPSAPSQTPSPSVAQLTFNTTVNAVYAHGASPC